MSELQATILRDTAYLAPFIRWSTQLAICEHCLPLLVRRIPLHVACFFVKLHLNIRLLQGHGKD